MIMMILRNAKHVSKLMIRAIDSTNLNQFIDCNLSPNWFCKSVGCSGIDLSSVVDVSTIDYAYVKCQEHR